MFINQARAIFPPELVPTSFRPGQVVVKPGMEITVPNQILNKVTDCWVGDLS